MPGSANNTFNISASLQVPNLRKKVQSIQASHKSEAEGMWVAERGLEGEEESRGASPLEITHLFLHPAADPWEQLR